MENEIEACRTLSQCLDRLGKPKESLLALLQSLQFGPPRAELCCDIGLYFFRQEDFTTASFFGMSWRSPVSAAMLPEASSSLTVMDTFPICSCASVITGWETLPLPRNITNGPGV